MTTSSAPDTQPENIVALPPPEAPGEVLIWKREKDALENTLFLALSHAIGNSEGKPCFAWVVTPILMNDAIRFTVNQTAPELLSSGRSDGPSFYETAREAQAWCEAQERELGGGAPGYVAPSAEDTPLVADAKGYCPTNKVLAKWSRNGGAVYFYRVWAKPDDPTQTQERELEGDEYEAALVGFVRQQLLTEVASRVKDGWLAPMTTRGPWGEMTLQVRVEFVECESLIWRRPEVLQGNAPMAKKKPNITVILDTPTHESVIRLVALLERRHRLELEAKAAGKSEEQLRAEIAANAAAAGISGDVLPVTIEDMKHVGVDPVKGVR